MEIEEILNQLESAEGLVPVAALTEAANRPVEMIPVLLKILEYTVENAEELIGSNQFPPIFAMMLLAQYRAKEAYQPVYEIFSLPGELSLDLTGDFVTEYLMKVLASICCGDLTLIQKLIEGTTVNEYVRSAALRSLLVLVASDEIYREEIVDYFRELFDRKLDRTPSLVWCTLVDCCGELHTTELQTRLAEAFRDDRVDTEFVSLDQIRERLNADRQQVLETLTQNPAYNIIVDVISELVG